MTRAQQSLREVAGAGPQTFDTAILSGALAADPETSPIERVFAGILSDLSEGRSVPGQRLVEADLSARFGVTRGAAREALKGLAAERVVELIPNRGAHIRILSRRDVLNILLVMEMITGLAARQAAENCDADGVVFIRARLAALLRFRDDPDAAGFIQARNEFLRAITVLARNNELLPAMRGAHVNLVRAQLRDYAWEGGRPRFEDFQDLADAIVAGDSAWAEGAARRRMREATRAVEKLPDAAFPLAD